MSNEEDRLTRVEHKVDSLADTLLQHTQKEEATDERVARTIEKLAETSEQHAEAIVRIAVTSEHQTKTLDRVVDALEAFQQLRVDNAVNDEFRIRAEPVLKAVVVQSEETKDKVAGWEQVGMVLLKVGAMFGTLVAAAWAAFTFFFK